MKYTDGSPPEFQGRPGSSFLTDRDRRNTLVSASGTTIGQIPKSVQGYQHNVVFSATDQDTVSLAAVTIKFYDGTTQSISLGSYDIPDASVRYLYFDLDDASPTVLKATDDYLSVLTVNTGVLCMIQKGSGATVKASIIPSNGKTPLITADIIYLTGLLDLMPDGTYGKVLSTIIAAGYIRVGSGTKDSTLNGFHIGDVEIVGQLNGVDQVVMGTNGSIIAGAGNIVIDANGITFYGAACLFYYGATEQAAIAVASGLVTLAGYNNADILIQTQGTGDVTIGPGGTGLLLLQRLKATPDAAATRAFNTTYTNNSGTALFVSVTVYVTDNDDADFRIHASADPPTTVVGRVACLSGADFVGHFTMSAIVPTGWKYRVTTSGSPTKTYWVETPIGQ